ncbi:hypothetical protein ACFQE1_16435 [Halobium palmae]|uniref:Uncharacterized protein n=1 Tax=Halobium palmae TaxID=1776492 RepID=A0ABD5S2M1_9EURY
MAHRTPDDEHCPVCGEPYERRLVIERGDDWGDIYPGSPIEFFRKFDRRCSAEGEVERDPGVAGDALAVYVHSRPEQVSLL